ncbi:MAG: acyl carrier protein [Deltaproteobacteria bacterium RIFOXYA12_FULL_61_11]|nr:MAG: acyl carrier protein [Deltaproteobacteria bacterium RIFOXYA12_FULL_61_11]
MSDDRHVYERLQSVFDRVFLDEVKVSPQLSAKDVDEWDSLLHVTLILLVEKEFGIRFATGEVEATENVGELVTLVLRHLEGG